MSASPALRVMEMDAECFFEVKPSNSGLGRPLGLQEVEVPRISRQSAYEVGKVVSPMHWPPLPPRIYPWYAFLFQAQLTKGPQCGKKN